MHSHRRSSLISACALLTAFFGAQPASAEPLPEAKVAVERLAQFARGHESATPRKIIFVYFTPADRTPPKDYRERLGRLMTDIQAFYLHEMQRHGLGDRTIHFDTETGGALVVHDVKGRLPAADYLETNGPTGELIRRESRPSLTAAGVDDANDTIIYFCDLRTEENGHVTGIGPYYGTVFSGAFKFGHCWFTDATILDPQLLVDKTTMIQDQQYGRISVGRYNSFFIGGAAHELGHSLGLPHDKQRADAKERGRSLMGSGNQTYGEERRDDGPGSFLTFADALRLASHPMFSGTERDLQVKPDCILQDLHAEVRDRALVLTGRISSAPKPYAVIAYNDPEGNNDYDATAWTAPLDSEDRFTLRIGQFKPGPAELRITVCLVNGSNTTFRYPITAGPDGTPDATTLAVPFALREALQSWAERKTADTARLATQAANNPANGADLRQWAATLAKIASPEPPFPALAALSPEVKEASLSRVAWQEAQVGWNQPARNHFPREVGPELPFLSLGGRYFTDGLYAHAPSRYLFTLDGAWKAFAAEAGIQPGGAGSGIFVVKADGRELYRSPKLDHSKTAKVSADVTGVKSLELLVEDAGQGNRGAWAIWAAPRLTR